MAHQGYPYGAQTAYLLGTGPIPHPTPQHQAAHHRAADLPPADFLSQTAMLGWKEGRQERRGDPYHRRLSSEQDVKDAFRDLIKLQVLVEEQPNGKTTKKPEKAI
ncbi:hypothetical protein R3P38DRAFT_3235703 [Favolaschia claudopus]|uniref:Uncharacterized protein n=1 Tax=Favolaschia claudopus TaxID=2862362 RepID=A0AAV9ZDN1_9AGAR